MSKNILLCSILSLIVSGCKTIDYCEVRAGAMQGQSADIATMQAIYLEISPSSRLAYMSDLADLNRRYPTTFQTALSKQNARTQEAIGYLINAETSHRSLLDKINKTHGSNNSP